MNKQTNPRPTGVFVTLTAPRHCAKRTPQEIWDLTRERLKLLQKVRLPSRSRAGHALGAATQSQGGGVAVVAEGSARCLQAWVALRFKRRDVTQISLAVIALDAGWQLGALPRNGLLRPLRGGASVFGLAH